MSPTEQTEPTGHESPPAPATSEPQPAAPAAASPAPEASSGEQPAASSGAPGAPGAPSAPSGAAASPGDATPGAEGGEKKRRRRRRRKKKSGEGGEAHAAGEGTAAGEGEGGGSGGGGGEGEDSDGDDERQSAEGESKDGEAKDAKPGEKREGEGKRKRKKKKRSEAPTRERPAFNVSDVVFGKIIEINDDVILVDLSGKAKAIFDKLELVLPEDSIDVEDDARRSEELAESILAGTVDPEAAAHAPAATEAAAASAEATAAAGTEAESPAGTLPGLGGPLPGVDSQQSPRGKIIRIVRPSEEPAEASAEAKPEEGAPAETQAAAASSEAAPPAEAAPEGAPEGAAEAAPAEAPLEAASPAAPEEEPKPSVVQLPRVVLEPGAPFVGVVRNDGARGGLVVLTHHPHRASKSKPAVVAAFKKRSEIPGIVTGVIKGGVEVDIDGVRAFAPGSQMELRLGADLHHLVGKRLAFNVTHYAKRGRDVIVSRRNMLEVEAKAAREAALSRLAVGQIVDGTVRSVLDFGAFIDLGGVDGLVPRTEMSHNRGDRPNDVFKVGEKIPVLIQKIDDKGKISLSRKATLPDPWGEAAKKYAVGTKHTGKVARILDFGAFIELEPAIDGLIHTADLSFKRIEKPEDVVKVGDSIEVVVSSLDSSQQRIGLHPALTGALAEEAPQRVEVGRTLKVQVIAIDTGGLNVRVLGVTGRSARGFIPASATGTPRGTELRKIFPVGHTFEAKVIERDPRRGEVKLSIKALQQDTERNAYQQYRQQVKREAKFGTFADLLAKKNQK